MVLKMGRNQISRVLKIEISNFSRPTESLQILADDRGLCSNFFLVHIRLAHYFSVHWHCVLVYVSFDPVVLSGSSVGWNWPTSA